MRIPDWLADFDQPFAEAIARQITPSRERRVAAFDADGTLWYEDIGEAFARWLAAGGHLEGIADVPAFWEEYERRVDESRIDGYTWVIQVMAGLPEADVQLWCRQLAAAWSNYRPLMRALIAGLQSEGFETWIVSASNRWVVHAGAPHVGIPQDKVIGIQTQVVDGLLTTDPVLPRPCNQGKVDAIKAHIGVVPTFAFGDSMGDFEMLGYVEQALVVGRNDQPDNELIRQAGEKGWPVHRF